MARHIRKRYGRHQPLAGLGLTLHRGETLGLLGREGAGKSTALAVLSGAIRPDTGDVWVCGEPDPTRAELRIRVGLAPERLALYPELTAEENLAFFGRIQQVSEVVITERIDWALATTGLAEHRDRRAATFSLGMLRRLNLACAIMHGPEVLLVDQPTSGADPRSCELVFTALDRLHDEGTSILYATEQVSEVVALCDRVAIIHEGCVLAEGTTEELVAAYAPPPTLEVELTEECWSRLQLGQIALPPGADLDDQRLVCDGDDPLRMAASLHAAGIDAHDMHLVRPDLDYVFRALAGPSPDAATPEPTPPVDSALRDQAS